MMRTIGLAFVLSLVIPGAVANATPFVPGGLVPGDTYQLAFVTRGTTDALSSDIADYNLFVQAQAALNPALTGTDVGVNWFIIGSTTTVDANVNAANSADDVYLLDGTQIASAANPLYSGTLLSPLNIDQFGVSVIASVWTGSLNDGTAQNTQALGDAFGNTRLGNTFLTFQWLDRQFVAAQGNQFPVYALSEQLTVPIPEPASLVLLGLGGLAFFVRRRRR